jgi:hypothetical protein
VVKFGDLHSLLPMATDIAHAKISFMPHLPHFHHHLGMLNHSDAFKALELENNWVDWRSHL